VSRYLNETLDLKAMPLDTLFEGEGDI